MCSHLESSSPILVISLLLLHNHHSEITDLDSGFKDIKHRFDYNCPEDVFQKHVLKFFRRSHGWNVAN